MFILTERYAYNAYRLLRQLNPDLQHNIPKQKLKAMHNTGPV